MDWAIFSQLGSEFLFRWVHFLAGITWIGVLYYFNFIQGEWFKEISADVKGTAIKTLVPRALWWFRWGAMFTFLSGAAILLMRAHSGTWDVFNSSWGVMIGVGAFLGTLMFLNVWLIIWPNQKIVIRSAQEVSEGREPLPQAAAALAKAGLASRTNTLFSIPMLFFMGAAAHLPMMMSDSTFWSAITPAAIVIAAIEINAIFGRLGPLASVKGVIHSGIFLTIILYALLEQFA